MSFHGISLFRFSDGRPGDNQERAADMSVAKVMDPLDTVRQEQNVKFDVKTNLTALLRSARGVVAELQRQDELVYCISEGNLPQQGGRLVVHYLGRKRFANDFLAFYDRDAVDAALSQNIAYSTSYLGFLRERAKLTTCPSDADILLVDNVFTVGETRNSVQLAPHINAVLPVQNSLEEQLALIRSKGHRRKLQASYKRGFTWRKTHSLADFNLFYDTMYEPFVHDRFRFGASIVPREEMYRIFTRRGFLLLLEEDGVPISGAMMYTSRQNPHSLCYWKYGLANSKELTPNVFGERNGTTEAMVLQYAVAEKYKELDFGLTRAMPRDGIFTHKKRLGCDFRVPQGTPQFRMFINACSKARFLSRFPLVVLQDGEMHSWTAQEGELEAKGVEDFKENLRACAFGSLKSLRVALSGVQQSRDLLNTAVAQVQQDTGCPVTLE